MGYRSDVYSCIYGDADEITVLMAKDKLSDNSVLAHFGDAIKVDSYNETEKIIILELQYYKWYDEFVEVQAWGDLLTEAEERGLCWEFVAIGEDNEINTSESADSVGVISITCNASIGY